MGKRVITMGNWEGEPIEWIVLKEDGFQTLVISKKILFNSYFDNNNNNWNSSYIRIELNSNFYNNAFSGYEKRKIINAKLNDVDNAKDYVFLLSKENAECLMTKDERNTGNWILRSPHSSKKTSIWFINSGDFDFYSGYKINQTLGIRPAMYIKE